MFNRMIPRPYTLMLGMLGLLLHSIEDVPNQKIFLALRSVNLCRTVSCRLLPRASFSCHQFGNADTEIFVQNENLTAGNQPAVSVDVHRISRELVQRHD